MTKRNAEGGRRLTPWRVLKGTVHSGFLAVKYLWLTVWTLYQIALGAILVGLVYGTFKVGEYFSLWDIRKLQKSNPPTTAFMEAERARLQDSLLAVGKTLPDTLIRWSWTPFDSIPLMIRELTLIAEDAKFYDHQGFDLEQIEYAIVANHQAGKKARGASTITQQVAKNLYLTKDREMSRKAREAILTLLLEHHLSKDRILEIYLNVAQFDRGIFGIREAARHHYRKALRNLTQEEAINLVSLLPAPAKWDFRRPNNAFLQHKRLVMRNYSAYKGIKLDADTTLAGWRTGAFATLAENLAEDRWRLLRSKPNFPGALDSDADTLARPTAVHPALHRPAQTF